MNETFPKELEIKLNTIGKDLTDEEKQSINAREKAWEEIQRRFVETQKQLELQEQISKLKALGYTDEQIRKLGPNHLEYAIDLLLQNFEYEAVKKLCNLKPLKLSDIDKEFIKIVTNEQNKMCCPMGIPLNVYKVVGGSITGNFFNPVFNLKIKEKWHK